jgi:hypothetical protein
VAEYDPLKEEPTHIFDLDGINKCAADCLVLHGSISV